MKGIDLGLVEAAELLGYSPGGISDLVERQQLAAEGEGAQQRIPLQSLARYVGISAERVAVHGLQRVVDDQEAWARVFGEQATARSPHGPVGRALRRALAISEIRSA